MTSTQIRCFLQAAESGSFTAAAEELYMTQPTFGRQIAGLEREWGMALFVRGHKACRLTPAGEMLYHGMRALRQEYGALLSQAQRLAGVEQREFRLGLLEGQLLDATLGAILRQFRAQCPGVEVAVERYTFHGMLEALRKDTLDLGITLQVDVEKKTEFEYQTLYRLKNEMVFAKASPLAQREHLSFEDFMQETFIGVDRGESEVLRDLAPDIGWTNHKRPKVRIAADLKVQIMLVESGQGVAAFNQYHQTCNHPALAHVSLPEVPDTDFCMVWRKGNGDPAIQMLRRLGREACQKA